jgi:hypothetical protein
MPVSPDCWQPRSWLRRGRSILLAAALAQGLGFATLAAEVHSFTDQQGRTLKAEIENVIGQDVSLQREDGGKFKVKIAIFSEPDQDYILQWALKQAADQKGQAVTLTAAQSHSDTTVVQASNMIEQKWQAGYKVKLENQTSMELQKLRLDYQIFKHAAMAGSATPADDPITRTVGTLTVDLVPPSGEVAVETAKTPMTSYTLDAGLSWGNGASRAVSDELLGIWIRLYTAKGDLIEEWSNSASLMKKQKWDDAAQKKAVPGGGED